MTTISIVTGGSRGLGRNTAISIARHGGDVILINVHVKGVFFLTQALLPLLADGGRIVNFSSGLTRVTYPGFSAYSAAKGAIVILTVYMAKELGSCGITANAIAPGAIETDFLGGAVRDTPEYNQAFANMGRGVRGDGRGVHQGRLSSRSGEPRPRRSPMDKRSLDRDVVGDELAERSAIILRTIRHACKSRWCSPMLM